MGILGIIIVMIPNKKQSRKIEINTKIRTISIIIQKLTNYKSSQNKISFKRTPHHMRPSLSCEYIGKRNNTIINIQPQYYWKTYIGIKPN